VSGTALIALLGQTSRSLRGAMLSERVVRAGSERLATLAVMNRSELVARVGITSLGGWAVRVSMATPTLFDVAVMPSDSSATVLSTTFYRRAVARDSTP